MRSEKRRQQGGRQNQRGRGAQEMSTEEGGEEGRRRKGEFCGFATGPLIKMHKLSKCGEFDELSSLATLDAKCGQTIDRGREVGFHFVCKAFLITLLEQRRRHFTEREKGVREGAKEKKKKKPAGPQNIPQAKQMPKWRTSLSTSKPSRGCGRGRRGGEVDKVVSRLN